MKQKLLLLSAFGVANGLVASERPMNVIYILADDLGYGDLSVTGQTKFKTPNIDKLAAEGMLFTQHYAGSTVSAPSRSALMTGFHTGHTHIRGNKEIGEEGQEPLPADSYTLAKMFKQGGYVTGMFGKWGLGYPGSVGDPMNQGFDNFFGYNCQRQAHRHYPPHLWKNNEKVILAGNANKQQGEYAPFLLHAEALKFITANKAKPFFAYLSYTVPHADLIAAPDDAIFAQFKGKFKEDPFVNTDINKGYTTQLYPYAAFATMVTRLDQQVGEVVAKLKELGLDKNTIIFFTSDNGPHEEGGGNPNFFNSAGPYKGPKRSLYEGGIRLPLIAWAPGKIKGGVENKHICAGWDMLPTLAGVAGVKLPKNLKIDGISMLPSLMGKGKQKQHKYLYWEFHEQGGRIAVRKGNWKLLVQNVLKNAKPQPELYDLSKDIHEDNNVASQHPELVKEILRIMREARVDSKIFNFASETKIF